MEEKLPKAPPIILHMLINCLASFIALIISPALPELGHFFKISTSEAKFSMSYYLVGYAIGVLIYAPITSRFGRKTSLYLGFSIALLGAVICLLAKPLHSFALLNIGRFILAIGSTAGIQVSFTMIADCYRPPRSLQISAYMMLSFAIGPSLGIFIGGLLTALNWELIFYFIITYTVFLLFMTKFFVYETMTAPDYNALKFKPMIQSYWRNFLDKRVLSSSILLGSAVVFGYVFMTASPFIVISMLKVSPEIFGVYNLIPPIGLVVGSYCSIFFVKKCGSFKLIWSGITLMALMSITMLVLFLLNDIHPFLIFLPFTIILIGQALVSSNVYGLCMHHTPDKPKASSLLNFINLTICSGFTFSLSLFDHTNFMILPMYFMVFSVLLVIFGIFFQKTMKKAENAK